MLPWSRDAARRGRIAGWYTRPVTESDGVSSLDAFAAAAAIRRGELSPAELVEDCLARIEELDGEINAFTVVLAEPARAAAREVERLIRAGEPVGPLAGVPVAIKDHIWLEGELATNGSRSLADFRPTEDAGPVEDTRP